MLGKNEKKIHRLGAKRAKPRRQVHRASVFLRVLPLALKTGLLYGARWRKLVVWLEKGLKREFYYSSFLIAHLFRMPLQWSATMMMMMDVSLDTRTRIHCFRLWGGIHTPAGVMMVCCGSFYSSAVSLFGDCDAKNV